MASTFPGAIDNFTDPLSNSSLASPSHAGQHSDLNDAVEKVEQYMGLVKVIPTAITGGTISATGTVTVGSAVSSVAITCFSSLYDNYRIVLSNVQSSASDGLKMRIGNVSSSVYYGAWSYSLYSSATPVWNGMNATAEWVFGLTDAAGPYTFSVVDISNPATSLFKMYTGSYYGRGYMGSFGGTMNAGAAYTTLNIFNGTGTLTGGTIRVYGYRN